MAQLWKLVLLCGLLAGTSTSLLDVRGNDVLRKLISGLERGLGTFDSYTQQCLVYFLSFRWANQVRKLEQLAQR